MKIDPDRLRELRKRKGFTRAQLATKSSISQRQITRLESDTEAAGKVRERTVNELAKALAVEPGVLTGEVSLPAAAESPHRESSSMRQVGTPLMPKANLDYALVTRRYGVSIATLIHAAPLMFMLLAEGSFLWRREKMKDARYAGELLFKLAPANFYYAGASNEVDLAIDADRRSVEQREIFGESVLEELV